MKLWEIDSQIEQLIDWETGEILDVELLNELEMERNTKIENVALYIKDLTHGIDAYKQEIENLTNRKKVAENAIKRLKGWLSFACENKKFETSKAKITFRQSQETVIDSEIDIPAEFKIPKEAYTISKTAIKEAIMNGETVTGAHIETKWNATIK